MLYPNDLEEDDPVPTDYIQKIHDAAIGDSYRSLPKYPEIFMGSTAVDEWFRANAPSMSDDEFRENAIRILDQKLIQMIYQRKLCQKQ